MSEAPRLLDDMKGLQRTVNKFDTDYSTLLFLLDKYPIVKKMHSRLKIIENTWWYKLFSRFDRRV